MQTRGGWFGVIASAAAVALLVTLSFSALCLCSDEGIVLQPDLGGCGMAARQSLELTAGPEAAGDVCLGPCLDVRVVTVGAAQDELPTVAAAAVVGASLARPADRSPRPALRIPPRSSRQPAEHLAYTILRC